MTSEDLEKVVTEDQHFNQKGDDQLLTPKSNISNPQFFCEQSFTGTYSTTTIDLEALPSAPDGGYGWIVVFAAFLHSFFIDGIANSFSLFLPLFRDHFQSSVAVTSFIGSALIGCYHIVGPVVSGLVNAFGCRKVVLIGALISSAAFALSVHSPSIYFFMLTYGILGGTGFGLIYLPSIVCLSCYFEKKRAIATGLAVAGSGVGTFVMPFILGNIIAWVGWKHSLYFLSAFSLSCLLYGLLYRPLETKVTNKNRKVAEMDAALENVSLNVPVVLKTPRSEVTGTPIRHYSGESERTPYRKVESTGCHRVITQRSHSIVPQERLSPNKRNGSAPFGHSYRDFISRISFRSYTRSLSHLSQNHHETRSLIAPHHDIDLKELFRPLNRNDVFYQGSIHKLPEYENEGCSMRNYRASQISIPTDLAVQSLRHLSVPDSKNCLSCTTLEAVLNERPKRRIYDFLPLPIKGALQTMDFTLVKEPVMIILLLSNLFGMQAFYIPFMFIRQMAIAKEVILESVELLLPLIGLSNTLGRVIFGWLADQGWMSALFINSACLFVCGLLCIGCPWLSSFVTLAGYAILFGFIIAAFSCLPSIILAQLMGIKHLTNSFGLLIVSRGIAALIGAPIGGFIYDKTGSYNATFYFAGVLFILSGLAPCLIPLVPQVVDDTSHIIDLLPEKQEDVDHEKLSVLTEQSEEDNVVQQKIVGGLNTVKS